MTTIVRIEVVTLGDGRATSGVANNIVDEVLSSFELDVTTTATAANARPDLASVADGRGLVLVRLTAEGDAPIYAQRVKGDAVASATPPAPALKCLVGVPEIMAVRVADGEGLSFVLKA